MSYNGVMVFNSAIDQAKKNAMDYIQIQQAQQNLDQNQQKFDIDKKQAALTLEKSGMDNEDTAMNLKAKKAYMDQMFGNQQDVLDGHQAMIDQQEQKTVTQAKQAHSVAEQLFNTDPDVRNYATSGGSQASNGNGGSQPSPPMSLASGGQGPDPTMNGSAASAPVADGSQNQGQAPNQDIAGAYKDAGSMTVPGPQGGSMVVGGNPSAQDSGTIGSGSNVGSLFGMPNQQGGGGASLPAQTQPQVQAPQQNSQNTGTQAPPAQVVPDISQERAGYDTSPITASSIAEKSLYPNPDYQDSIMNHFMFNTPVEARLKEAEGGVDIEKEKNPFFLNQWQQHLIDDQTSQGSVLDNSIRKYGLNTVLQEFPNSVVTPAIQASKYQQDPNNLSSTMGGGAQRRQMNTLVHAINPNWSEVKYAQIKGNIEQYLDPNTANGKALQSLSQVGLHLNTLDQAMSSLNSTQYRNVPIFNKSSAWWNQNMAANPKLAAVNTALSAVHNEVTSAWAGTHNSDAKQAEWNKAISNYSSSGDWPALRSTIATLLNEAGDSRESQFEGLSNGMSLQDYRGYGAFPPEQKAILTRLAASNKPSFGDGTSVYKPGDTRNIGGVTYTRNAQGQWSSQ